MKEKRFASSTVFRLSDLQNRQFRQPEQSLLNWNHPIRSKYRTSAPPCVNECRRHRVVIQEGTQAVQFKQPMYFVK
jgi:hypothetical protein